MFHENRIAPTRNIVCIERYYCVPEGVHVRKSVKLRPWQCREISKMYDNPERNFHKRVEMKPLVSRSVWIGCASDVVPDF
jgi:hypothetical protein